MESTTLILVGIGLLLLLILLTILLLLIYSGLLHNIEVKVGEAPLGEFIGFYKVHKGPYKNVGTLFDEAISIDPLLQSFGIYYDEPSTVAADDLRCVVGSVVRKDKCIEDNLKKYEDLFSKHGFQKFDFPKANKVVKATFPYTTPLSIYLAVYRLYPQMETFIKTRRLTAYPFLEYYTDNVINTFAPLDNHLAFYPPDIAKPSQE